MTTESPPTISQIEQQENDNEEELPALVNQQSNQSWFWRIVLTGLLGLLVFATRNNPHLFFLLIVVLAAGLFFLAIRWLIKFLWAESPKLTLISLGYYLLCFILFIGAINWAYLQVPRVRTVIYPQTSQDYLEIKISKPLQADSAIISVRPKVDLQIKTAGFLPFGTTLLIKPESDWLPQTDYRIEYSPLPDLFGKQTELGVLSFIIDAQSGNDQSLIISSSQPAPGEVISTLDTGIVFVFSQPVDTDSVQYTIEPNQKTKQIWTSQTRLQINPDPAWVDNTAYQISII
ncbi:MAG TPA: hypothetical protein ENN77_02905, partial [Candidatus Wirthbacteria bacterium]|nr:hypothetical protein [Candidatus Wirthbacteria bacterium]